jgi:hypothetical protein
MSAAAPSPRWVWVAIVVMALCMVGYIILSVSASNISQNGLLLPSSYACGAAPWWPRKRRAHFLRQGQVCMASPKVIIEEPPFDAFAERFKTAGIKVGDPRFAPETEFGIVCRLFSVLLLLRLITHCQAVTCSFQRNRGSPAAVVSLC